MDYLLAILLFCGGLLGTTIAGGLATITCAQTGGVQLGTHGYWKDYRGFFTIGAKNFEAKHSSAYDSGYTLLQAAGRGAESLRPTPTTCPYEWNVPAFGHDIILCPGSRVEVRTNLVMQEGRVLKGWLHVEVELTDKEDRIMSIYVQMRDEYFNAVGEFITDPTEQCSSKDPLEYVRPTKYQHLPCSATGAREAKNSQVIFMTAPDELKPESRAYKEQEKFLPQTEMKNAIQFTWRYSEYWCSRHARITPDVLILTKKEVDMFEKCCGHLTKLEPCFYHKNLIKPCTYQHGLLRKIPAYWLKPNWFGTADIVVPGRGPLDCSKPVVLPEGDKLSPSAANSWIPLLERSTIKNDYYAKENQVKSAGGNLIIQSCQLDPYYGPDKMLRQHGTRTDMPVYAGRCADHKNKDNVNANTLHSCNTDSNSTEFGDIDVKFTKYSDYVKTVQKDRRSQCSTECRAPKDENDTKTILQFEKNETKTIRNVEHLNETTTRSNTSVAQFWRGRKYHGIMSLIATMFVTPLSIFSARYYKETFMKYQCKGAHLWFWVHIGCTIASVAMHFSALTALQQSIVSWGRSESSAGQAHTGIGWFSHALFLVLSLFGGFRVGLNPNGIALRLISVTAHSVLGFVHYISNVVLIIISTNIPASPSLDYCGFDGMPRGVSRISVLVISWLMMDICFHLALTLLQILNDKKLKLRRRWYCPIIPILPASSHDDMKGTALRRILIVLYIVVSFSMTMSTVLYLSLKDRPTNCATGGMTCKEPLGCTKAAKLFYNKFVKPTEG